MKVKNSKAQRKCTAPQEQPPAKQEVSSMESAPQAEEKTWLESLSPEERAVEEQKMKVRQKKAESVKQQQEAEQKRRAEEERSQKQAELREARKDKTWQQQKLRLKEQGVLEAQEYGGKWYVEVGGDVWREVLQHYYCIHCEAGMNEAAIDSHIHGERHRKRSGAKNASSGSAAAWLALPVCCNADLATKQSQNICQDQRKGQSSLETWQELDADGHIRCIPCNKYCDGVHEQSAQHKNRLWAYLVTAMGDYEEPEEEWLAWVPCSEWGEGLFLKCLLCDTFTDDFTGTDARNYDGWHSRFSSNNCKKHRKKMENLKEDRSLWNNMLAERCKWQLPQKSNVTVQSASTAMPSADELSAGLAADIPPVPQLPDGWSATWCEQYQQYYFHSLPLHDAQWELPTTPAGVALAGGA